MILETTRSLERTRSETAHVCTKNWITLLCITLDLALLLMACSKSPELPLKTGTPKPEPTQPSTINVDVAPGAAVTLTTTAAEFRVTPDGYVKAFLLPDPKKNDGKKLTLDEPNVGAASGQRFCAGGGQGCALHARLPAGRSA